MTKEGALYQFFSSFGLAAYEENAVPTEPDNPSFPYITYEVSTGNIDSGPILLSASVWDRSSSWVKANRIKAQIAATLACGGCVMPYDGGWIWLTQGTPFAQSRGDPDDEMIKRKLLNIAAEYISAV